MTNFTLNFLLALLALGSSSAEATPISPCSGQLDGKVVRIEDYRVASQPKEPRQLNGRSAIILKGGLRPIPLVITSEIEHLEFKLEEVVRRLNEFVSAPYSEQSRFVLTASSFLFAVNYFFINELSNLDSEVRFYEIKPIQDILAEIKSNFTEPLVSQSEKLFASRRNFFGRLDLDLEAKIQILHSQLQIFKRFSEAALSSSQELSFFLKEVTDTRALGPLVTGRLYEIQQKLTKATDEADKQEAMEKAFETVFDLAEKRGLTLAELPVDLKEYLLNDLAEIKYLISKHFIEMSSSPDLKAKARRLIEEIDYIASSRI